MPPADVFVHAGDFSSFGAGVEEFALWYWHLPYAHKFVVLGNHETRDALEKRPPQTWRKLFGPTLLEDEARRIDVAGDSIVLYGAPFGTRTFEHAPAELDVFVTHEPPLRILDRGIGSSEVAEFVRDRQPSLHLFGHVHQLGGRTHETPQTRFVNAATRSMLVEFVPSERSLQRPRT